MPEHPQHQHNHQHHHSAVERAGRAGHEAPPADPYPYIYSKDPMDERRFLRPGEAYGPASSHGPSSWVLWLLGVILALVIGAGLLSIIIQGLAK